MLRTKQKCPSALPISVHNPSLEGRHFSKELMLLLILSTSPISIYSWGKKKVKFSCWKIFYWFNDQAEGLWIFSFSFLSCDPSASTPVLCAGLTWAPESSLGSGCSEQSRKKCEALWWLLWFLLSVLQGSALFWCSVNDKYVHLVWFCREVWTVSAGTCLLV